jgi:hypothetical protein
MSRSTTIGYNKPWRHAITMDNTNSYLLNCTIDGFAHILAERISFCPPVGDDLESEEPMMFANALARRYAEIIGQSKVAEIANSSGTPEEKLEWITKEIEQEELAEDGILLDKDLCKTEYQSRDSESTRISKR